ncbi:LysR family transcriptional regulator [Zavarzinia compransoris]|uniref:LysR family transcriptional regulator n=1 Tax=Zavarzinia TaxID=204446 RepID=UPI0010D2F405|nr:LysR substrate-binding domain-containing protein [Zavarzinia compransoris]TDP45649.1 LysR family transcriptional regulator [Zavarzinia compransoris]
MDLKQIRYVVAAAECRSFRRAAQQLRVQPSAVSKRILELEARLGVALFVRTTSGVTLTEAGRCFVVQARKGVDQLDAAATLAKSMGRGEFAVLRVGFFSPLASGFLARLAAVHRGREPGVRLDWNEGIQPDLVRAIERQELDVAFVCDGSAAPGCETVPLWLERLFVVMPAGELLSEKAEIRWQDLEGQHFIVSDTEPGCRMHEFLVRHLSAPGHEVSIERCRVGLLSLYQLVALGRGFALTAETATVSIAGTVCRPLVASPMTFVAIWWRANQSPALRKFIDLARSLSPEHGLT